jgi:hypothetical protein
MSSATPIPAYVAQIRSENTADGMLGILNAQEQLEPRAVRMLLENAVKAADEVERLTNLIHTPEVIDFTKALNIEAAFQREKWGAAGDAGKSNADWFWLIGYLAGKALHNPGVTEKNTIRKQLHRIITVAAAACNWHLAVLGKSDMRPGIMPAAETGA